MVAYDGGKARGYALEIWSWGRFSTTDKATFSHYFSVLESKCIREYNCILLYGDTHFDMAS